MPKVVLLPGHGGFDPGAVNPRTGARECDGNLNLALKLGILLQQNGIEVIYSRKTDTACGGATTKPQDIANQIGVVNNSNADIAVAIHFNGFSDPSAHGVEVLYNNDTYPNPNEAKLAKLLLDELVAATGLTNRGLKEPDNVSIVKKVKIPCVLSENAFVTNDKESVWCTDPDRITILAVAHAKAICKYFGKTFTNNVFSDVASDRWSSEAIKKMKELGIMQGYTDGTFKPTKQVTREELAAVINNLLTHLDRT